MNSGLTPVRARTTPAQRKLTVLVRGAVALTLLVVAAQLWTTDLGMDERLVGAARVVSEVDPVGPAARAGITVGDEILADPGLDTRVAERTEREAYAWSYRMLKTEVVRADHERRQIAMELHDGVGATLSAARSMARRLRAQPSGPDGANGTGRSDDRTLDALDETLRDGLGDLRASLTALEPAEGDWVAVVAHLRRHVSEHCAAEGTGLTFHEAGDVTMRLSAAGRLTVLRVVQEAVNNALKHGHPKNVHVQMDLRDSGIEIVVEDDGSGGAQAAAFGRGLGNMARRVHSLAGVLHIGNAAPHGTRVAMSLPSSSLVLAPRARTSEAS